MHARRPPALAGAVALAVTAAFALCGCQFFNDPGEPDGPIATIVEAELRPLESQRTATIDFDDLVDGDWTRVIMVCTRDASLIERALGFEWEEPRDFERRGSSIVFATDAEVEASFSTQTFAAFDDRQYVIPCTADNTDPYVTIFERDDSAVQFHYSTKTGAPGWVLDSGQGTRLVVDAIPPE